MITHEKQCEVSVCTHVLNILNMVLNIFEHQKLYTHSIIISIIFMTLSQKFRKIFLHICPASGYNKSIYQANERRITMLKGVNKQVVDVSDTGSDYFERALFFVDPKYYGLSESKLREKAQNALSGAGTPPKSKPPVPAKMRTVLCLAAAAAAGSVITLVLGFIIF